MTHSGEVRSSVYLFNRRASWRPTEAQLVNQVVGLQKLCKTKYFFGAESLVNASKMHLCAQNHLLNIPFAFLRSKTNVHMFLEKYRTFCSHFRAALLSLDSRESEWRLFTPPDFQILLFAINILVESMFFS